MGGDNAMKLPDLAFRGITCWTSASPEVGEGGGGISKSPADDANVIVPVALDRPPAIAANGLNAVLGFFA
jgi:hypothetical protein